jgi:5'-phosphate synthase pdxT subunit
MTCGVLALQGAFVEHEERLALLGEKCVELKCADDLRLPFDRLVLPGGESTVQSKLLRTRSMLEPLRQMILAGMPTLGTCAGLILLAQQVTGGVPALATMPVKVLRNAYGRQLQAFTQQQLFLVLQKTARVARFR